MENKQITISELGTEGPMDKSHHGRKVTIEVVIGYPGSTVTDILIGDHKVQVPNTDLRAAAV